MSGNLYLSIHVLKDGDRWSVEGVDDAWTLATTAPNPERLAGQLQTSLSAQRKKPHESELPKVVQITVEIEEFGLNSYQEGYINFTGSPTSFEVRSNYGRDIFRQAWEMGRIRESALNVSRINGSGS